MTIMTNLEIIAYQMFERQAKTMCDDPQDLPFVWQMEDDIRKFWLDEAKFVLNVIQALDV